MDVASKSSKSSSSASVPAGVTCYKTAAVSSGAGGPTAAAVVQLPYFPHPGSSSLGGRNDTATGNIMQFYAQAAAIPHNNPGGGASSAGTDGVNNNNAPTVQLQHAGQQYLNPALAYQQWFSLQVQQQQQQNQQNDGQQQQLTFSVNPSSGDGGALTFGYDPSQNHQNMEFHNGQVQLNTDGALSLSTLQSFANSLSQHGQGQAFMIQATPVSANANGLTSIAYQNNNNDQHHGHQQSHQHQGNASTPKTKGPKKGSKAQHQQQQQQHHTPTPAEIKAAKPPKPKGSPNAYALFYKDTYAKLRGENPDWKASQIMAEAGRIWKDMNGTGQDIFRARAEVLNQQHQLANAATKTSHKKQKNAQKRPMTAYQLFIREHFGRRPQAVAQMHAKDFLLQLSVQWKNLEPAEKQMYQDKAKAEKTRRETETADAAALAAGGQPPIKLETSVPSFAGASS